MIWLGLGWNGTPNLGLPCLLLSEAQWNDMRPCIRVLRFALVSAPLSHYVFLFPCCSVPAVSPPRFPVNEVFDIQPIRGVLQPNQSEKVQLVFFGHQDARVTATACCEVSGGPEYDLSLKGEGELRYHESTCHGVICHGVCILAA